MDRYLEMTRGRTPVFITTAHIFFFFKKNNWVSALLDGPPGAQPGLVPTDACHVPGEQWWGGGTKWDQEPAGEAGVDHEAGGQPVWAADGAQGAGMDRLIIPTNNNKWRIWGGGGLLDWFLALVHQCYITASWGSHHMLHSMWSFDGSSFLLLLPPPPKCFADARSTTESLNEYTQVVPLILFWPQGIGDRQYECHLCLKFLPALKLDQLSKSRRDVVQYRLYWVAPMQPSWRPICTNSWRLQDWMGTCPREI